MHKLKTYTTVLTPLDLKLIVPFPETIATGLEEFWNGHYIYKLANGYMGEVRSLSSCQVKESQAKCRSENIYVSDINSK